MLLDNSDHQAQMFLL